MEMYIQEISSLQFIHLLEPSSRQRVFSLVDSFHAVLLVAEQLQASLMPTERWYSHYAGG